jgi:hypothetical protein
LTDSEGWYGRKPDLPPLTDQQIRNMLAKGSLHPPTDGPGPSATRMWLEAAGIFVMLGVALAAAFVVYKHHS